MSKFTREVRPAMDRQDVGMRVALLQTALLAQLNGQVEAEKHQKVAKNLQKFGQFAYQPEHHAHHSNARVANVQGKMGHR
jgi:hypothetical protein